MSNPFDIPAIVTNRISATVNAEGVRISFGETPDGKEESTQYRTAIYLTPATLEAFRALLADIAEKIETSRVANDRAN